MYCEGQPAYIRGDEGEAATDEHILFGLKSQFQNNLNIRENCIKVTNKSPGIFFLKKIMKRWLVFTSGKFSVSSLVIRVGLTG